MLHGGDAERMRQQAAELIALTPDAIFVTGNSAVSPLPQQTRTVPIVFALLPDPVGAGFVNSLAQPGGKKTAKALDLILPPSVLARADKVIK